VRGQRLAAGNDPENKDLQFLHFNATTMCWVVRPRSFLAELGANRTTHVKVVRTRAHPEFFTGARADREATHRSFATRVPQLKICDFSGEAFKGFEVL